LEILSSCWLVRSYAQRTETWEQASAFTEQDSPTAEGSTSAWWEGILLTDECLLRLLTRVRIERSGALERARAVYEAAADPEGPVPKLENLINARWIRVVRNRIVIPVEFLRPSQSGLPQKDAAAYAWLQEHQYDVTYSFDPSDDPELESTIRALEARKLGLVDGEGLPLGVGWKVPPPVKLSLRKPRSPKSGFRDRKAVRGKSRNA
jgi:hypothetical protein